MTDANGTGIRTVELREGALLSVVTGNLERLIRAAVHIPGVTHFAAVGGPDLRKWFHPVARTREVPSLQVPEIPRTGAPRRTVVACSVDFVAKESVARFLLKASNKPSWPGAVLWHWWLYSDDVLLFGAYDWPQVVRVDQSVAQWEQPLLDDGTLRRWIPARHEGHLPPT